MATSEVVQRCTQYAKDLGTAQRIFANGRSYSYADLMTASNQLTKTVAAVLRRSPAQDKDQPRLAYCLPPNFSYLATQYSAWMTSSIAVPLHPQHPKKEIDYIVGDSDATALVCSEETESLLRPIAKERSIPLIVIKADSADVIDVVEKHVANQVEGKDTLSPEGNRALLIYTSGTTGKPKGVVWTHAMLTFQYRVLSQAWGWQHDDRIINFLPLHHVHGLNNIVGCALWNGAQLEMCERFKAREIWDRICAPNDSPTVFMGVPTIYAKMIAEYDDHPTDLRREAVAKIRLFVSGSAALQNTYFRRWKEITGQSILERYGMSEVGMALSNLYHGERREGWVGKALPQVQTKVVDPDSGLVVEAGAEGESRSGELLLSGPGVFKEYWRRTEATKESFDKKGAFKTGDIVEEDSEGWFRILGRRSVDIIKSGGYKISALEIERELIEHSKIAQAAVVGIADEEFGQVVGAMLVLKSAAVELDEKELRSWCKERLASYKIPRIVKFAEEIPRNAMGKIEKKKVEKYF